MKRNREEVSTTGGSHKRQAGNGRGETSESAGPQTQQTAGQQKLTTDDALAYLKAVKEKFKDDKAKYEDFLDCMKDFKAQRTDTAGVIARVKELFKGHRQLILGFNTFLPKGYEITMPPEEPPKKQPVEFDQAINYVNKIKTRFQNDEHVYKSFLEILNMYRKGNKNIQQVYQEVAHLFSDHSDLLHEFTFFLPDHSNLANQAARPAPSSSARPADNKTAASVAAGASRSAAVDKPVKKEKPSAAGLGDSTAEKEVEKPVKAERDDKKAVEKVKDRDIGKEREKERERRDDKEVQVKEEKVKKEERDDRDKDVDTENETDPGIRPIKRSSARRADVLIKHQAEGREAAGPSTAAAPAASEDKKPLKAGSSSKDMGFLEKVKLRLRNREHYQEFLKVLYQYNQGTLNLAKLQEMVKDALHKHQDLMDGFNEFITRGDNLDDSFTAALGGKKVEGEGLGKKREPERVREVERPREREKDKAMLPPPRDTHKAPASGRDKYMYKPVSELDLSNSETCTPSYRLLPKNYPRLTSSHRTELGNKVLNDNWVSVTSGSEDYSFKFMRKNQYEESLFRCEDDRFELDMLLESTAVTAKKVAELVENLHKEKGTENKPQIPTKLEDMSPINLRCVERIYGDHGLDIQELLRKNTAVALPVILQRLRQKHEEWQKCREEMNKVWAEVYAKNYHKSLDHRSFYFKQQDKKTLSVKGLLAEIKEVNEKKKRDDDNTLLAIAAGNRRPLIPDIRLEYNDPAIHEDIYKIVKFSTEEVCTSSEQNKKVMKLWTSFVEPFLGVPPRSHGAEDAEEATKAGKAEEGEKRETAAAALPEREDTSVRVVRSSSTSAFPTGNDVTAPSEQPRVPPGEAQGETANGDVPSKRDGAQLEGEQANAARQEGSGARGAQQAAPGMGQAAEGEAPESGARKGDGEGAAAAVAVAVMESLAEGPRENAAGPSSANGQRPEARPSSHSGREEGELSPSPEAEEQQAPPRRSRGNGGGRKGMANGVGFGGGGKGRAGHRREEEGERERGSHGDHHDRGGEEEGEDSGPSGRSSSVESDTNSDNEHDEEHDEHDEEEEDEHEDPEHLGKGESEGEAEGGADGDDEDMDGTSSPVSSDTRFFRCKPLAAHPPSMARGAASQRGKQGRVFYANDLFYVLFRLHQKLYERVLSAKVHAHAQADKWKNKGEGSSSDPYAKFMELLFSLLDGSIENSKFEDDCRTLIGTQSYVLFTLDKLIYKLIKQLQAAATEDVSNKLLVLYSYERNRPAEALVDSIYHANACVVLHDENIYRTEYKDSQPRTGELTVQLMEGPEKLEVPAAVMEPSFGDYLMQYVNSIPDPIPDRHHVFLHRNEVKVGMPRQGPDNLLDLLIELYNGLECKISCSTSKVSYVLDTEDVFVRKKKRARAAWQGRSPARGGGEADGVEPLSKRVRKFREWAESRANEGPSSAN